MDIKSTYIHIRGFGKATEKKLWESGLLTWNDYIKQNKQKGVFSQEAISMLKTSNDAYRNKNLDFFSKTLPQNEYYRLALSFPEDVLFLDIKTTGLSTYYDYVTMVGWSQKDKYDYYIYGLHDIRKLKDALDKAKIIITFNGSVFDIPFLKKHFKELKFPTTHIDLRFLSKSSGLECGRKKIEEVIGFKRPKALQETNGFTAALLWDEYKWGKKTSLEKLIAFNHSDIESMKVIFDYCTRNIYKKNNFSRFFKKPFEFKKYKSTLDKKFFKEFVKSRDIPLDKKSTLRYKELADKIDRDIKIVGIDLTGSEKKAAGVAFLNNDRVTTSLIKTDDEMIEKIVAFNPHIVSIDSPLSLPYGRLTVFDDDPTREEFGILRECERVLKKRGVNVYPTLLPSMQKLTKRGIELATKLRARGVPAIESYPGAIQDIIGLPRKQASLELLKKGLGIFGLKGDFLKKEISHDEIDAITIAIIGIFFLSGDYEAIGDLRENLMIIPNLHSKKTPKKVYGFCSSMASSKTKAINYLEAMGYECVRYSSAVEQLLKNKKINNENPQEIRMNINESRYELSRMIYSQIADKNKVVIDDLTHLEDYTFFFEMYGFDFELIFVESSAKNSKKRYVAKHTSDISKDTIEDPTEKNIKLLKNKATKVVQDDSTIVDFKTKELI